MILQLNPSIPVNTPNGTGEAILIIDYGKEDDLLWTVFLDETGQCWTFNNKEIRAIKNVSIGRNNVDSLTEKVQEVSDKLDVMSGIQSTVRGPVEEPKYSIYGDPNGEVSKALDSITKDVNERNALLLAIEFNREAFGGIEPNASEKNPGLKVVDNYTFNDIFKAKGNGMTHSELVNKEGLAAIEKLKHHDANRGLVEPKPASRFKNLFWGYE